jgi:RNase P subunit RPR2
MVQSGRRDETTPERRRLPGAVGYLFCRHCKARFVVAGRRRGRRDTPSIELVVCPECRAARRMVLPPDVGAPFRIVSGRDKMREGQAP